MEVSTTQCCSWHGDNFHSFVLQWRGTKLKIKRKHFNQMLPTETYIHRSNFMILYETYSFHHELAFNMGQIKFYRLKAIIEKNSFFKIKINTCN